MAQIPLTEEQANEVTGLMTSAFDLDREVKNLHDHERRAYTAIYEQLEADETPDEHRHLELTEEQAKVLLHRVTFGIDRELRRDDQHTAGVIAEVRGILINSGMLSDTDIARSDASLARYEELRSRPAR